MEKLTELVDGSINGVIWNIIPWLLIAAGIYFGLRTLFVQIRLLPAMLKAVAEKPPVARDEQGNEIEDGVRVGISAFKAFTISAASRVGTGTIARVALAISICGSGAVLCMSMIAIVGVAAALVECMMAQ